jgi:hypothetical protein
MSLAKAILFFALTQTGLIACVVEVQAQTTQGRQPDLQRGIRNYQDILSGRKRLDQLTPQEQQEVLTVHRRIKAKSTEGKSPECKDAQDKAATAATELADRSKKLRNCAEAEDYSEDCSSEFRRVKSAYSDYEDAVSAVGSNCN